MKCRLTKSCKPLEDVYGIPSVKKNRYIQMKFILKSIILLTCVMGFTQNKQLDMEQFNEEEKEVITVTDKLTELMIQRDLDALDLILDKNYTLTHITGYVQPKAEWFKEVETESMKYYSYQAVKHRVKINGNKAEVVQQNKLDARIWSSRNVWRLQQIFQLEKRDDKWIILKSVATTF